MRSGFARRRGSGVCCRSFNATPEQEIQLHRAAALDGGFKIHLEPPRPEKPILKRRRGAA